MSLCYSRVSVMSYLIYAVLVGFCLLSAVITYTLGIYVFAQKPSSSIHRLFLVMTLAATCWAFGEFFFWQATTYDAALFWLKISSFWTLVVALTVHFVITYTDAIPSRGWHRYVILGCGLYLPAVLFSVIEITTDWIYVIATDPVYGYVYLPVLTNPVCLVQTSYYIAVMVWAASAGYRTWRDAPSEVIRRQNFLVGIGIGTLIVFGSLSSAVLPYYGIYLPNLIFIGIVLFCILIARAIRRYGLFILSPETAVVEILRTMPDGMVLMDMDEHIIAVNPSATEIFRDTRAGMVGRTIDSFIPADAAACIRTQITNESRLREFDVILPHEVPTVVSIAGSVVMDENENPAGSVLIIRDITERKSSETALRVANEKLSMLSQLTRHDISNLVTALYGYLTMIEDESADGKRSENLSVSLDIVDSIIDHLHFSREYEEIGSKHPVWQSLELILTRATESLPHADVRVQIPETSVEVYADPLSEKVFYNLLENALRHGETVTSVSVTMNEEPCGSLVLAFEDNGMGIPDDEKERVFRFGYGKNTGFGLAFSREILSVTGIEIAETGVYGEGARFEIRIPPGGWRYSAE